MGGGGVLALQFDSVWYGVVFSGGIFSGCFEVKQVGKDFADTLLLSGIDHQFPLPSVEEHVVLMMHCFALKLF